MAKRYRIRDSEAEHTIPELVNQGGQAAAAEALGVSQAAISQWLKANGFRARTIYARADGIVECVPDAPTRARLAALNLGEMK